MQLVQRNSFAPAVGQRGGLVVGVDQPGQVGCAEQGRASRGRSRGGHRGPPGRRARRTPSELQTTLPDHRSPWIRRAARAARRTRRSAPATASIASASLGRDVGAVAGELEVGEHPPLDQELRPRVGRRVRQRHRGDVAVARAAERVGPRVVGRGAAGGRAARPRRRSAGRARSTPGSGSRRLRPSTSGIGAPPASASQSSPAASTVKKSSGACGRVFIERRAAVAQPKPGRRADVAAGDRRGGHDRGTQQLLGTARRSWACGPCIVTLRARDMRPDKADRPMPEASASSRRVGGQLVDEFVGGALDDGEHVVVVRPAPPYQGSGTSRSSGSPGRDGSNARNISTRRACLVVGCQRRDVAEVAARPSPGSASCSANQAPVELGGAMAGRVVAGAGEAGGGAAVHRLADVPVAGAGAADVDAGRTSPASGELARPARPAPTGSGRCCRGRRPRCEYAAGPAARAGRQRGSAGHHQR